MSNPSPKLIKLFKFIFILFACAVCWILGPKLLFLCTTMYVVFWLTSPEGKLSLRNVYSKLWLALHSNFSKLSAEAQRVYIVLPCVLILILFAYFVMGFKLSFICIVIYIVLKLFL